MMENSSQPLESKRIQTEYCEGITNVAGLLQGFATGMHPVAAQLIRDAGSMQGHVADTVKPFNVAVFGRMKSGKSSLINALIGRRLAVTGVDEMTATINRLVYASGREELGSFKVHWKDSSPESFPLDRLLTDWNGKAPDVLERVPRVKYLELFADAEWLRDIQVTDTPGTGSTAAEHEDVAQQFINGKAADALIYVFSPVGRQTDVEDLESFRKGCLPGSSPYNSVAVMHKWDETYWNNGGDWADITAKAKRLHSQMSALVADVVPVSGPLALTAQLATPEFWASALGVLAAYPDEKKLNGALISDRLWNTVPAQKELYAAAHGEYDMPWTCFRVMLRELHRKGCSDAAAAAQCITELSGIRRLREMLDKCFFTRSAIIRMRHTRSLVQDDVARVLEGMRDAVEAMQDDARQLEAVAASLQDSQLRSWVEARKLKINAELQELSRTSIAVDRLVIKTREEIQHFDNALELASWLEQHRQLFPEDWQVPELLAFLRDNSGIPREHLQQLYTCVCRLAQDIEPTISEMTGKLRDIMMLQLHRNPS